MIKVDKDLLSSDCHIICHQCNCFRLWGKGLSEKIKKLYPEAYLVDNATESGSRIKLGSFSYVYVNDFKKNPQIVVNLYCQYGYGKSTLIDFNMIEESIEELFYWVSHSKLKNIREEEKIRIGFPHYMGCSLLGWNKEKMLNIFKEFEDIYQDKVIVELYN